VDDTDYTVAGSERVAAILRSLDDKFTLVSVRLGAEGPLHTSALIRLDPQAQRLYLDEFNQARVHHQVSEGTELRVFASLRGVAIRFSTAVEEIVQEPAGALYRCPYPDTLQYLQRRETFRIHIPMAQRPQVELRPEAWSEALIGELTDLSACGMCVELPASQADDLNIRSRLGFHNLLLPDARDRLYGTARLSNRRRSTRDDHSLVGLEILDMSPWLERQLTLALLHYQREERRRALE
jgi:c-di-GMP-binding flagellar brake protein YcgR